MLSIRMLVRVALFAGAGLSAHARVRRVVVESTETVIAHAGEKKYLEMRGVAYGDLLPGEESNRIIQDINLAPKNNEGRVEYATTFTLDVPADHAEASGFLLYEVVNRGSSIVPRDYSRGDIFLRSGWQGDMPFRGHSVAGGSAETIEVPTARNADGSSIHGPALLRFINVNAGTHSIRTSLAVGYASFGAPPLPADLETSHARLITRTFEGLNGALGQGKEVAAEDWRWADCSKTPFPGDASNANVCVRGDFDPALSYQLEFQAKDPKVLGIGLAAVRDVASFFEHQGQDDSGWRNPVAGLIKYSIAEGASQSGNTIRTFLNLGFNRDESKRTVFDGAMVMIAARQNPINFRFAVPGGASNLYEPGSDGVVWWADWPDKERQHQTAGLLTRCHVTHSCPKIVEVLGSSEFWSLRASPDFVGTSNSEDIPLPDNVRRYYIASTQHGGGVGGFDWQPTRYAQKRSATLENPIASMGCVLPLNPNPEREINHALLEDLKAWVSRGVAPPPSSYPTLRAGELVPADRRSMNMPSIPNLPSPDGVANPLLVYDFGPDFAANDLSGTLSKDPPDIQAVIYPLVPRVDDDGNETSGVHTVLQQAPLGTYLGWNVTAEGFSKGQFCSLNGGYLPFARTKNERIAVHDPRLSLEERYGTSRGYRCAVSKAADRLKSRRLLLPEDATAMLRQAEKLKDLSDGAEASAASLHRAAELCQ